MSAAGAMAGPLRGRSPQLLPLLGAAALILAVLIATIMGRPDAGGPEGRRGVRALSSIDLLFEDRNDGAVVARAAVDGREVAVLAPGEDGFMRATLRGLARERRRGDLGREAPFRLAAWPDGGLSLEDTATGRTLDLRAFGPTQAEAFARLLPPAAEGSGR